MQSFSLVERHVGTKHNSSLLGSDPPDVVPDQPVIRYRVTGKILLGSCQDSLRTTHQNPWRPASPYWQSFCTGWPFYSFTSRCCMISLETFRWAGIAQGDCLLGP